MRRLLGLIIWILFPGIALAQLFPNLGGQRTGTSAAQFLKIGVGARGVGMGESFVAVTNDAEALYWNPAGIVWFDKTGLLFAHNQWLVDTQLEYAGIVFHLNSANSVGAAITYLHTEEMEETTELQPFGTGRKFGFSDFLLSLTYARRMTSQFSFGVSAKFMQETIADLTMRSVLFDLGTFYDTGWKSIRFAVTVTNFGANMSPSGTVRRENLENETEEITSFQSFPPPILFRIGVAAELMHSEQHRLTGSVQLNHPNDNTENINIGLEYSWNERIAFRGGFKTAQVEENFSAGFGLHVPISLADFRLDYAFTNFGRLGTVNRFAIQLMF
ncbi:MAG: hypothetical protein D6681_07100 [Calditrichaeota bacterium]|nr:MAG: hypothetical protein D6681_07100 [Calditrichota bacterium]